MLLRICLPPRPPRFRQSALLLVDQCSLVTSAAISVLLIVLELVPCSLVGSIALWLLEIPFQFEFRVHVLFIFSFKLEFCEPLTCMSRRGNEFLNSLVDCVSL